MAQAETQLAAYLTAETAVLNNQSYTIAGRSMTRANLKEIRDGIEHWDAMVKKLTRGGVRVRGGVPVNV